MTEQIRALGPLRWGGNLADKASANGMQAGVSVRDEEVVS
jgi:hypothetical protein